MEWWYGLIIFFGVTLLAGLVGAWLKAMRLKAGIRYGDEKKAYQCEGCGGHFYRPDDWSDEDVKDEYEENYSHLDVAEADRSLVCDECYKDIIGFNLGARE